MHVIAASDKSDLCGHAANAGLDSDWLVDSKPAAEYVPPVSVSTKFNPKEYELSDASSD